MATDLFHCLRDFAPTDGRTARCLSLPELERQGLGAISRLPVSLRVVLESLVRNLDDRRVREADVRALAALSSDLRRLRAPDGSVLTVPEGWALLPLGDPGLTRRVKAAGPSWTVVEKKGRKIFSKGVWAPATHIERARADLAAERADPKYAKRLEAAARRRDAAQAAYVVDFESEILRFLRFAPAFAEAGQKLARVVTLHATPVGSGTVARTERIPMVQRAESAVIAWLRHQTTAYDSMVIPRVRGMRREGAPRAGRGIPSAARPSPPRRSACRSGLSAVQGPREGISGGAATPICARMTGGGRSKEGTVQGCTGPTPPCFRGAAL